MSLLQQQAEFAKRQRQAIDNAPQRASIAHTTYVPADSRPAKRKKPHGETKAKTTAGASADVDLSKTSTINAANFGVMARIVDYMKKRHLGANTWPLTMNEILEEMQIFDLGAKMMNWLIDALPNNPRLQMQIDGASIKYVYKPPHRIKNRNQLLTLIKKYHTDARGALLLSELNDCIANARQLVDSLGAQVIGMETQANKRKDRAYFYNDAETDITLDEEFVKLWRNVPVEHVDEKKIEEYLQKHNISTIKDLAPHRVTGVPKRKQAKRRANAKVQNTHMEGVLFEYEAD